ncbi:hypothetical protein HPB51_015786 [Rhipicephalus microplus]|uniref:Tick transposon n=1 Tax=Rhipicephalus microplus TaxID=6941 RepID=A0A9J6EHG5_RHIMP|nr:hypothetical protein HPB51_015786 [Rhipicephalus microplus]
MKHPTDVDLFMALEMIATAWIVTSPAVITNCFTHAGLVTPQASCTNSAEPEEGSPVGAFDDGTGNSAVPPSLTSAWRELCAVANEIPDGLSVHEFICADKSVVVHEEVTDKAIVSSVCEVADSYEQEPEQPEKTTGPQDVLNVFDTIRTFFGEHDDDEAMDHFLQCGERPRLLERTDTADATARGAIHSRSTAGAYVRATALRQKRLAQLSCQAPRLAFRQGSPRALPLYQP